MIKHGQSAVHCLFAPETLLHFAGQNGSSDIKMKLQLWQSLLNNLYYVLLALVWCMDTRKKSCLS